MMQLPNCWSCTDDKNVKKPFRLTPFKAEQQNIFKSIAKLDFRNFFLCYQLNQW